MDTAYPPTGRPSEGRGWAVFAGSMFLLIAAYNLAYGISALAEDDHFVADELLFGDLALWGVLALVLCAVQVLAGVLILRRRMSGATLGLVLAGVHAMVALLSISAYPLWSVVALVIDGLLMYVCSVHGAEWE